jgi:hypothetical protein
VVTTPLAWCLLGCGAAPGQTEESVPRSHAPPPTAAAEADADDDTCWERIVRVIDAPSRQGAEADGGGPWDVDNLLWPEDAEHLPPSGRVALERHARRYDGAASASLQFIDTDAGHLVRIGAPDRLYVFDRGGNLLAEVAPTYVESDGELLCASRPSLGTREAECIWEMADILTRGGEPPSVLEGTLSEEGDQAVEDVRQGPLRTLYAHLQATGRPPTGLAYRMESWEQYGDGLFGMPARITVRQPEGSGTTYLVGQREWYSWVFTEERDGTTRPVCAYRSWGGEH